MNEIIFMQIRMVRMAVKRWKKNTNECARIFEKYRIFEYIEELYCLFHVQGDEADFDEIEQYLKRQGAEI